MTKRIKTARVFTIGFIGDAEVIEGAGDCLALGVGTFGETIGIIERHNSPILNLLRNEMDANPLGYANIITLTGENVTDSKRVDAVWQQAGRQVDIVLQGIFSVSYLTEDETKVDARITRRGQLLIDRQPRYEHAPNNKFHCLCCGNDDGRRDGYARTVETAEMEEVRVNGRLMTIAPCPECDSVMTRIGGINAKRENHGGLSERRLFYEPPEHEYCLNFKQNVKMIWVKSVRKSDDQPRPSYRGNCFRCLGMVGTPWHRTKMVPIKTATLEKLLENARDGEDALYAKRMAEARERRGMRGARDAFNLHFNAA